MITPARVLVMDATGRLSVRSELRDVDDVELYKETFAEEDSGSNRGGGRRGDFEGGGFEMDPFSRR